MESLRLLLKGQGALEEEALAFSQFSRVGSWCWYRRLSGLEHWWGGRQQWLVVPGSAFWDKGQRSSSHLDLNVGNEGGHVVEAFRDLMETVLVVAHPHPLIVDSHEKGIMEKVHAGSMFCQFVLSSLGTGKPKHRTQIKSFSECLFAVLGRGIEESE